MHEIRRRLRVARAERVDDVDLGHGQRGGEGKGRTHGDAGDGHGDEDGATHGRSDLARLEPLERVAVGVYLVQNGHARALGQLETAPQPPAVEVDVHWAEEDVDDLERDEEVDDAVVLLVRGVVLLEGRERCKEGEVRSVDLRSRPPPRS